MPRAVDQRDAAPGVEQRLEVRRLARRLGARALGADGAAVLQELARDLGLLAVVHLPQRRFAAEARHRCSTSPSKTPSASGTSTPAPGSTPASSVAVSMPVRPPPITSAGSRTCKLAIESALYAPVSCSAIRKSRGLAHAADQVVLHVDDRRLAGAGRDRDVVEADGERVLDAQRAAEAHAAVGAEVGPPRQRQVDRGQEVLVPAHGDAVLGDAAEAAEMRSTRSLSISPKFSIGARRPGVARRAGRPAAARSSARRRRRRRSLRWPGGATACSPPARARRRARSCRCTAARTGGAR